LRPDSNAWRIENIGRLDLPSADQPKAEAAPSADSAKVLWIARALIVIVACGLAWYTWGRWGDFQIDCGRELYVPAAILHGKLLYRDLWYMYGPLAPYLQALAFRIFGISLTVLYLIGLVLTIASALLIFEIARQFDLVMPVTIAPAIFFLSEAYSPFIFNYIFPYSYAATLASTLGLACLYSALRYLRVGKPVYFPLAAFLAGLVLLTKQEFGLACLVLLGSTVTINFLRQRSLVELKRNFLWGFAGLSPAVAVYGCLVWKLTAKVIFIDNWIATPGTYMMRTFGGRTMALNGYRLSPHEWIVAASTVVVALGSWYLIAASDAAAIRRLRLRSLFSVIAIILVDLLLALIILCIGGTSPALTNIFSQIVFPKGLFLLGCLFTLQSMWDLRTRSTLAVAEAALGIYATVVCVRVMMEVWPTPFNYAVFFNLPLFLIFVIVTVRVVRRASQTLDHSLRELLVGAMVTVDVLLLFVALFPRHQALSVPLTTDYGTFYTSPDVAVLFPRIISFMKTHTRNGRDILVLPEPPSLYVFAGVQAPSRWYSLLPGYIEPLQEEEFIRDIISNDVRYVLISNRAGPEYGVGPFGIGYDQPIYEWLMENYEKAGQFGPLPGETRDHPYIMSIFVRKSAELRPIIYHSH
jgi:hypothetical protein